MLITRSWFWLQLASTAKAEPSPLPWQLEQVTAYTASDLGLDEVKLSTLASVSCTLRMRLYILCWHSAVCFAGMAAAPAGWL